MHRAGDYHQRCPVIEERLCKASEQIQLDKEKKADLRLMKDEGLMEKRCTTEKQRQREEAIVSTSSCTIE